MADVQLERGNFRVANRLDEAITFADFTLAQMRVVRCLLRLTYGWRRRTVRLAHGDLALRCNLPNSGGFRRALDELIREGVVLVLEPGHGHIPTLYAVQKDFERWGRFSVAEAKLSRLFDARPDSDDAALDRVPLPRHPERGCPDGGSQGAPVGSGRVPPPGQGGCLSGGTLTGANSRNGADLDAPKDRKDRKDRKDTTTNPSSAAHATAPDSTPTGDAPSSLEAAVAAHLPTDADRVALTKIVARAPDRLAWLGEMHAALEGMGGHHHLTGAQLGDALRDFVANGAAAERPSFRLFRGYLRNAAQRREPAVAGATPRRGGTVAERTYQNAVEALEDL